MRFKTIVGLLTLAFVLSSFQRQNDEFLTLKKGYYKFPNVAHVTTFYYVNGRKITFYRMHAGHYAAFGTYHIDLNDSVLIVNYNKTIASSQFKDIEPFESDTIEISINSKNKIELIGLTYIEPESGKFCKNIARIIKKNSKRVKHN